MARWVAIQVPEHLMPRFDPALAAQRFLNGCLPMGIAPYGSHLSTDSILLKNTRLWYRMHHELESKNHEKAPY
jgi:hypothetical protein